MQQGCTVEMVADARRGGFRARLLNGRQRSRHALLRALVIQSSLVKSGAS
ncbi:hypothetical protein KCP73_19210 [Salmonella enterica subsp. enterica]|nr:hypothetical protein KCP73_19210 [Salmonella enterica subsp. enterica]